MKFSTNYTFHSLGLKVSANRSEVLDALHQRLKSFKIANHPNPDLNFEYHCIPSEEDHILDKPSGKFRSVYDPPVGEVVYWDNKDQLYIDYDQRVRVLCEPNLGRARFSIVDEEDVNIWYAAHPLFTLPFMEMLKRRGHYSLHAAGLAVNGRGLLLPGNSGSGKSTLTIALLRAGFGFLGDDTVFLTLDDANLRMQAFPDEVDLSDETIGFFPELQYVLDQPKAPTRSKRPLRGEDIYQFELIKLCQPAVLVFPKISNTSISILEPMNRDEAFLELIPNVLLTEARSSQIHLDILSELVRQCDCYRLKTGLDFDDIPKKLQSLFE